jgi:hypothetical protein
MKHKKLPLIVLRYEVLISKRRYLDDSATPEGQMQNIS